MTTLNERIAAINDLIDDGNLMRAVELAKMGENSGSVNVNGSKWKAVRERIKNFAAGKETPRTDAAPTKEAAKTTAEKKTPAKKAESTAKPVTAETPKPEPKKAPAKKATTAAKKTTAKKTGTPRRKQTTSERVAAITADVKALDEKPPTPSEKKAAEKAEKAPAKTTETAQEATGTKETAAVKKTAAKKTTKKTTKKAAAKTAAKTTTTQEPAKPTSATAKSARAAASRTSTPSKFRSASSPSPSASLAASVDGMGTSTIGNTPRPNVPSSLGLPAAGETTTGTRRGARFRAAQERLANPTVIPSTTVRAQGAPFSAPALGAGAPLSPGAASLASSLAPDAASLAAARGQGMAGGLAGVGRAAGAAGAIDPSSLSRLQQIRQLGPAAFKSTNAAGEMVGGMKGFMKSPVAGRASLGLGLAIPANFLATGLAERAGATPTTKRVIGDATTGAVLGGSIGSAIPGVGTAVGAVGGGALGALVGALRGEGGGSKNVFDEESVRSLAIPDDIKNSIISQWKLMRSVGFDEDSIRSTMQQRVLSAYDQWHQRESEAANLLTMQAMSSKFFQPYVDSMRQNADLAYAAQTQFADEVPDSYRPLMLRSAESDRASSRQIADSYALASNLSPAFQQYDQALNLQNQAAQQGQQRLLAQFPQ